MEKMKNNFKLPSHSHYLISLSLLTFLTTILAATDHQDSNLVTTTMDKSNLVGLRREKLSRFKLYWHDILTGPRPTAVQIVAPPKNDSRLAFGLVRMIDNPLTLGPAQNSTVVGRAQGFYGQASQEDIALLMAMNFAFTLGKYNGSSITVLGRNPVFAPVRELPVIGGSGLFRFARGFAKLTTYKIEPTGDATVEYDISVLHY